MIVRESISLVKNGEVAKVVHTNKASISRYHDLLVLIYKNTQKNVYMHYNRLLYKLRRVIYKPILKLVILDVLFFLVAIGAFFLTKGYALEFFVFRYSIPLIFILTVWILVGYLFKKYILNIPYR